MFSACRSAVCRSAPRALVRVNPARAPRRNNRGFSLLAAAKRHPFFFQLGICTAKTSLCDIIIQVTAEGKSFSEIDWRRNLVFTAFGCVYLGGVQYWIYSIKFQQWFPRAGAFAAASMRQKLKDRAGQKALLAQIAFDNVLHNPFLYLPVFYVFKASIQEKRPEEEEEQQQQQQQQQQGEGEGEASASSVAAARPECSAMDVVKRGLAKWRECFWEDNLAMWALVIPSDVIVFGAPMWLRLPINHAVSFVWVCYLSFTRGDESEKKSVVAVATAEDEGA